MAELSENNIEWYTGESTVTLSFSQKRWINKIKKYAKSNSDVEVLAENADGSICAHVPLSWVKISPPRRARDFSEEERIAAAERLRIARESRYNKEN